jgi:hypothetical protein
MFLGARPPRSFDTGEPMTTQPPANLEERFRHSVGTWRGTERMTRDPDAPLGVHAEAHSTSRLAAGGRVLVTDYTQTIDGDVSMEGVAVTTWDPAAGCYAMYWFDGRNPPGRFVGDYEDGELVLEGEGHGMRLRHRTSRPDPDTMRTVSEVSPDGESWTVVFDGTNQRVP